jgi:hypothetical protein
MAIDGSDQLQVSVSLPLGTWPPEAWCIGSWVGPRPSLQSVEERKSLCSCLESNIDSSVVQAVTWSPYRLRYCYPGARYEKMACTWWTKTHDSWHFTQYLLKESCKILCSREGERFLSGINMFSFFTQSVFISQITHFTDVTQCSRLDNYRSSVGNICLFLQGKIDSLLP